MNPNEKKILGFTSAAHFLTHFYVLVFPALIMPMKRDLSLSIGTVIDISFLMYLCYGMLAIPWGYLSDRLGPRWIMGTGIIIAGTGFIAAGFAQNQAQLALFFGIVGIGCSAYHPSGLALLSKGTTFRGRALGINGMIGNLGIASAPFTAGILNFIIGWQKALVILGVAGILFGIFSLVIPFSVPRHQDIQKGTEVPRGKALTTFISLCFVMVFSGLMYRAFMVTLPAFLEIKVSHSFITFLGVATHSLKKIVITPNMETLIATIITGIVFLIGMIGQLLGGRVADRSDLRYSYLSFFCIALPFILFFYFLEGPILIAASGLYAFFILGMQPIENSLVAMVTPPQWRSISYGIKFTIVFGFGAFAVKMASLIEKKLGLEAIIPVIAALLVMVIATLLILIALTRGTSIRHEHRGSGTIPYPVPLSIVLL